MEDLLASIRGAYTKALAEGRTPTDAFPWLAHTSSKTLPSPELATIHQFYHNVVGSGPPPEVGLGARAGGSFVSAAQLHIPAAQGASVRQDASRCWHR